VCVGVCVWGGGCSGEGRQCSLIVSSPPGRNSSLQLRREQTRLTNSKVRVPTTGEGGKGGSVFAHCRSASGTK
jgi:hypothetical protein